MGSTSSHCCMHLFLQTHSQVATNPPEASSCQPPQLTLTMSKKGGSTEWAADGRPVVAVFPAAGYTLTLRKTEASLGIKAADAQGDDVWPTVTAVIPGGTELRTVG